MSEATEVYRPHGVGTQAVAVEAGEFHSLVLTEDGVVLAWGQNSSGQVGDGTTVDRQEPVQVVGWGSGPVLAIAAGDHHSLALLADGSVWSWGNNFKGQLGDGTTTNRQVPIPVGGVRGRATAVAAGGGHSLALLRDGAVVGWGHNWTGVLGDGTTEDRATPVAVLGLEGPVRAIATGACHCVALLSDGSVLCWGRNTVGQLGEEASTSGARWDAPPVIGRATPLPPGSVAAPVIGVVAGDSCSFALMGDGSVLGWGSNLWGSLGDGTESNRPGPVRVGGALPIRSVASGLGATLALEDDGRIVVWGGRYPRSDHDADIPVGATKLGGRPDLPAAGSWPASDGVPQSFLGQIDLAEVAAVSDQPLDLPAAGRLSFFYDAAKQADGYSVGDRDGWHAIFTEPSTELQRIDFPVGLPPEARYPGVRVRLAPELCLPSITSVELGRVTLDDDEFQAYQRLLRELDSSSLPAHRLLGYENPVQTGHLQQLVAHLGASAVEYLDPSPAGVARRRHAWDQAAEWHLLLQIDEDDEVGFEWSDAGRIFYWIRDEDLAAGRLDHAWLVSQSS